MIIGTAGHVDHGKTTLVKALTGVDTDRLKEEKLRGISIDLGFAYLPVADDLILGFVDVPGHERFVHTMVAGASGIDFALMVVAADDGVMPQTREHLAILDLLGIDRGLIVITKAELASEQRLAQVCSAIRAAATGTFLAQAEIIPLSAVTGRADPGAARAAEHGGARFRPQVIRCLVPSRHRSRLHASRDRFGDHRYRRIGLGAHRRASSRSAPPASRRGCAHCMLRADRWQWGASGIVVRSISAATECRRVRSTGAMWRWPRSCMRPRRESTRACACSKARAGRRSALASGSGCITERPRSGPSRLARRRAHASGTLGGRATGARSSDCRRPSGSFRAA